MAKTADTRTITISATASLDVGPKDCAYIYTSTAEPCTFRMVLSDPKIVRTPDCGATIETSSRTLKYTWLGGCRMVRTEIGGAITVEHYPTEWSPLAIVCEYEHGLGRVLLKHRTVGGEWATVYLCAGRTWKVDMICRDMLRIIGASHYNALLRDLVPYVLVPSDLKIAGWVNGP